MDNTLTTKDPFRHLWEFQLSERELVLELAMLASIVWEPELLAEQ